VDTDKDCGSIEMAVEIKAQGLQALIAGRVTGTCQALMLNLLTPRPKRWTPWPRVLTPKAGEL
jgi:hypothetical protein